MVILRAIYDRIIVIIQLLLRGGSTQVMSVWGVGFRFCPRGLGLGFRVWGVEYRG